MIWHPLDNVIACVIWQNVKTCSSPESKTVLFDSIHVFVKVQGSISTRDLRKKYL